MDVQFNTHKHDDINWSEVLPFFHSCKWYDYYIDWLEHLTALSFLYTIISLETSFICQFSKISLWTMHVTHGMILWQIDMTHSPEQVHTETSSAFHEMAMSVYIAPSKYWRKPYIWSRNACITTLSFQQGGFNCFLAKYIFGVLAVQS